MDKGSPVDKGKHYRRYGWEINEDNLKTLPATAPQEARDLTKWLTLEGRRKQLEEWLSNLGDDNRIHGKFWHIGAWTHRMSHTNPNQANIVSIFQGTPTTAVEEVKATYDAEMRDCWCAEKDHWLVGTDADAIQLRILAHYMKSDRYIKAICEGDKTKGTDIHNLNKDALGPICKSRDDSKTFIYAWLLGAGIPKIASILGCSNAEANKAVNNFLDAIPELKRLKNVVIPRDAARGFFIGLDGRRVFCNSEHLMLAGYLQNGESTIMKHANVKWRKTLIEEGIKFKQVDFVHDEWVVEVDSEAVAREVGEHQKNAIAMVGEELGVLCPLEGTTIIGKTWKDVH